ncbi:hypothetical protein NHX12_019231 [Muraenolepis orangiensis]|uniref:Uncharacterized protein n=1 Tax=Muraenolepis orangiensis TaxID=630683 RepID=A0A9Q0ESZ1_9TELE|nr:hypothetical protein NHX12_019231 [Muraenolepis orangiensis]
MVSLRQLRAAGVYTLGQVTELTGPGLDHATGPGLDHATGPGLDHATGPAAHIGLRSTRIAESMVDHWK